MINCKVELKIKWAKYCILTENRNDNANANSNNIVFTTKDTKLYVPFVTLSARYNQKSSKRLTKGFEWSVYLNEYRTKCDNENRTNEYGYFLE